MHIPIAYAYPANIFLRTGRSISLIKKKKSEWRDNADHPGLLSRIVMCPSDYIVPSPCDSARLFLPRPLHPALARSIHGGGDRVGRGGGRSAAAPKRTLLPNKTLLLVALQRSLTVIAPFPPPCNATAHADARSRPKLPPPPSSLCDHDSLLLCHRRSRTSTIGLPCSAYTTTAVDTPSPPLPSSSSPLGLLRRGHHAARVAARGGAPAPHHTAGSANARACTTTLTGDCDLP